MTTSTYAPTPSMMFPSIYGQPGFYGQFGYDQPSLSPFGPTPQIMGQQAFGPAQGGYGIPQIYGPQQFGAPYIPGQQFGISEQLGFVVQLLPQLLWAAQQNLSIALHLVQQIVQSTQQAGRSGFGEPPWARQFSRPSSMAW